MTSLDLHPGARAELRESIRYYETQQTGLGIRFLSAVRSTTARIERYPLMYRTLENDIRQCRVRHFPYGLIYRPRGGQLQIVAVMHLHRKPGYWKHRL